jgi:hypothetical protein
MAEATPEAGRRSQRWLDAVRAMDRLDLITAMTLVLLLVYSGGGWYVRVPVAMLGAAGLLLQDLRRRPAFWLVLAALLAGSYLYEWYGVDNHKWLYVYWCLNLGLALLTPEPRESLAVSSRWLVAACFVFATGWKLASPDFLDGSFFHYTFLTDRRLEWAAELLGGLPPTAGAANRLAIEGAVGYSSGISLVDLRTGPGVAALARALAWGTLAIEALVALAFLAPLRPPWATRVRAVVLAAFILGTYAIAPVIGFGWMLLILGLAQLPDGPDGPNGPDRGPIPALYLALFLLLPLYQTPWHELLSYLG